MQKNFLQGGLSGVSWTDAGILTGLVLGVSDGVGRARMAALILTLLGIGIIIAGSWLFLLFPGGGIVVIFLGLICIGHAGKKAKAERRRNYRKGKKGNAADTSLEEPLERDWGCLIVILTAVLLYVAIAVYNNLR